MYHMDSVSIQAPNANNTASSHTHMHVISCVRSHMNTYLCVQTDISRHFCTHAHIVQLCSKRQTSSFNRSKCRPSRSATPSRVSLCTHTNTHTHTHTQTHTHTHTHTQTHTHTHTHKHTHTHAHTQACMVLVGKV